MTIPRVPTDRPFTLQDAGCSRAVLRRLVAQGVVRRLVRGAYVHADLEPTPAVRHAALRLVLPAGSVPVGVTAAWAHGLLADCPHVESAHREPVGLLEAAVTAGRGLGLVVYDAALGAGLSHLALLQAVAPEERALAAHADARARGAAESRLRQAWLAADLPTPVLGRTIAGVGLRADVAHPLRPFAATVHPVPAEVLDVATAAGWWLSVVDAGRVQTSSTDLLAGHLRREFHRHLLAGIEVSPAG